MSTIDAHLLDWEEAVGGISLQDGGILIGNGASIAIWERFNYPSLFGVSERSELETSLRVDDTRIFGEFETTDFEMILCALRNTIKVLTALDIPATCITERYDHIRRALVVAVQSVHVQHLQIPESTLESIADELRTFKYVYSTNYDLLLYWAIMYQSASGFKDFFWADGRSFDPSNTNITDNSTRILFLHGALHLYVNGHRTRKLAANDGEDLLTLFENSRDTPLFVSEGTSYDKRSAILRNDYLSFAYSLLQKHQGPLVIFGHSLSEPDQHIVDAIKTALERSEQSVVIGIRPGAPEQIVAKKAHFMGHFPWTEIGRVMFFNTCTFSMGREELRIPLPNNVNSG